MADQFRPDAALLPLMPPDLLAQFVGDGHRIDIATGQVKPPAVFPQHIDRAGRGHYGGARTEDMGR